MKAHGMVQASCSSSHFLALVLDGQVSSDSCLGRFILGENIPIIGEYEAGWDLQSTWLPRKWDKSLAPAENITTLPKVLRSSSHGFVIVLLWL